MKRKILITGSGGFIGSHLVESCTRAGYSVKAFVRYNSQGSWGWLDHSPVKKDIEVTAGDIRDFDSVSKAMYDCNGVFHLAALIGIPYSYISPSAYLKTNIEGTYNVLESARLKQLENIVITSTSETYGTAQYTPIDEAHPAVGQSPYSATKIAADQLALSYHKSFRLPVKIARPFNTYGPRQSPRAVIPSVIAQILAGKEELNLGNLSPTRDFTFVSDTVKGFIGIFNKEEFEGESVNIGMGEEISIGELVGLISSLMGVTVSVKSDTARIRPRQSEVGRLLCDNRKLKTGTGWTPDYDLKKGLRETIDWLACRFDSEKADVYHI